MGTHEATSLLDLMAGLSASGDGPPMTAVPPAAAAAAARGGEPVRHFAALAPDDWNAAPPAGGAERARAPGTLAAAQAELAEEQRQSQFAETKRQADQALALAAEHAKRERERHAENARQRNKGDPDLRALTIGLGKSELPAARYDVVATTIYECGIQCSALSAVFWPRGCYVADTLQLHVAIRDMGLGKMVAAVIDSVLRPEAHDSGGNLYKGAKRGCAALLFDIYALTSGFDRGHIGVSPHVLAVVYRYVQLVVLHESVLHGGCEHDSAEVRMLQFCRAAKRLTSTSESVKQQFAAYRQQDFDAWKRAAQSTPDDARFLRHCTRHLSPESVAKRVSGSEVYTEVGLPETSVEGVESYTELGLPENSGRTLPTVVRIEDYQQFRVAWRPEYQTTAVFSVLEGVTAERSSGGMPVPKARCVAKGGNRAVAWVVARCVWAIVSQAAARAMARDCRWCHVTTVADYAAVLEQLVEQQFANEGTF